MVSRRLRSLLWEYSGQSYRDAVYHASIHVEGPDPFELIDGLRRTVVIAARYMRQRIPDVEGMLLPELNEYLRHTRDLIAQENGGAHDEAQSPRDASGNLRPAVVTPANGPAFAHEQGVR